MTAFPSTIFGHACTPSSSALFPFAKTAFNQDFCLCPRQESNLRTRFRKPLLYPLSYGGVWLNQAVSGPVVLYLL